MIDYTAQVENTGGTTASGVQYTQTLDPNTSLVAGSVEVSPLAGNDTYSVLGNVPTVIPAPGLLANDSDPDASGTLRVDVATVTRTGGSITGTFTAAADGGFTYTPPTGLTGFETFTYNIKDEGGTGQSADQPATVTFNVGQMIWFIDNSLPTNGDGSRAAPFNDVSSFAAVNDGAAGHPADGQTIFLFEQGGGPYAGPFVLRASQKLIGQGSTVPLAAAMGITAPAGANLPSTGGASPLVTNPGGAGVGVELGPNNLLRGFNLGDTGGAGIEGSEFTTVTIRDLAIGGQGQIVDLGSGAVDAVFTSWATTAATSGARLFQVSGTMQVAGATTITSSGVGLDLRSSTLDLTLAAVDITFAGANAGLDLRKSSLALNTGNLSITGDGTAGGIGIDLSGAGNPNGLNSNTPNLLLGSDAGETATIFNAATGVRLGNPGEGTAGAYLKYGTQLEPNSGSSIDVSGGWTIDSTNLTSTDPFTRGRYEFLGTVFGSGDRASFEISGGELFFVAANATGTGDGSTPANRANEATLQTQLTATDLAGDTVVLIDDGNPINTAGVTLNNGTILASFGTGSVTSGLSIPVNVAVTEANLSLPSTINDPTGNGAARLVGVAADTVTVKNGNVVRDVELQNTGGGAVLGGDTFTGLTVERTAFVPGGSGLLFNNSAGAINLTDSSLQHRVQITGGNATVGISEGTGSITNASLRVAGPTGGSVTLTGGSLTADAAVAGLTVDGSAAPVTLTNVSLSYVAANPAVSIDATTPSTAAVMVNGTSTLADVAGRAIAIGPGARNIDLTPLAVVADGSTATVVSIDQQSGGTINLGSVQNSNATGPNVLGITGMSGGTASFGDVDITNYGDAAADTAVATAGTGGTVTFAGVNVATTNGAAFTAAAQTLGFGTGSAFAATGAPALQMNGSRFVGAETLASLTATTPNAAGVDIKNTTGAGSLTVTGNTTVTNSADLGMYLGGNADLTFGDVTITDSASSGVFLIGGSSAFTFEDFTVSGNQAGTGLFIADRLAGSSVTFATLTESNIVGQGVRFLNTHGSVTINGGSLSGTSGPVILSSGGSYGLTCKANLTQATNNQYLVDLSGHTTGTMTFDTGTLTVTDGQGILFSDADGLYQFNGPINLSGLDGDGLTIQSGSSGTFQIGGDLTIASGTRKGILLNSPANAPVVEITGNVDIDTTTGVGVECLAGSISVENGAGDTVNVDSTGGSAILLNGVTIPAAGFSVDRVTSAGGARGIDILSVTRTGGFAAGEVALSGHSFAGVYITGGSGAGAIDLATGGGTFTIDGGSHGMRIEGTDALITVGSTGTPAAIGGTTSTGGDAIRIFGGSPTFRYYGSITNTADDAIEVQQTTGGSAQFSHGTITDSGSGILVGSNAGSVSILPTSGTLTGTDRIRILSSLADQTGTVAMGNLTSNDIASGSSLVIGETGLFKITGLVDLINVDLSQTSGSVSSPVLLLDFQDATFGIGAGSSITTAGPRAGLRIADMLGNTTIEFNCDVTLGVPTTGPLTLSPGLELLNNSAGTTTSFGAKLAIATDGPGLVGTSGGTLQVAYTPNSQVNTVNSTAVSLTDTPIGPSGVSFARIDSGNGLNAIKLVNAGNGGFNVVGNGLAGSGGTLQNTTGRGVEILNTDNVSLNYLTLTNLATLANGTPALNSANNDENSDENAAIHLASSTGIDLISLTATSASGGNQHGLNAYDVTDLDLTNCSFQNFGNGADQAAINLWQLKGTAAASQTNVFNNVVVSGSGAQSLVVRNNTATNAPGGARDRLDLLGCSFTTPNRTTNDDNLKIVAHDNANFQLVVKDSTLTGRSAAATDGNLEAHLDDFGVADFYVNNTTISGARQGIFLDGWGNSLATFYVHNNPAISTADSDALELYASGTGTARFIGTVENSSFFCPSAASRGINLRVQSTGTSLVDLNGVTAEGGESAIQGGAEVRSGQLHLTIRNSTAINHAAFGFSAISAFAGDGVTAGGSRLALDLVNNTADADGASATTDYAVAMYNGNTFDLEGFSGNGTVAGDVEAYIASTDTDPSPTDPTVLVSGGVVNYTNGAAAAPPAPTVPLLAAALPAAPAGARLAQVPAELAEQARRMLQAPATEVHLDPRLASAELALTDAAGIRLSPDAAGWGWFVDPTPLRDEEFAPRAILALPLGLDRGWATRELTALPDGPAAGKMDLLTALAHEYGHRLGLHHVDATGDLLSETLEVGVRRLPANLDRRQLLPPEAAAAPVTEVARESRPSTWVTVRDEWLQPAYERVASLAMFRPRTRAVQGGGGGGTPVVINLGDLPAGQSVTIRLKAQVNALPAGTCTVSSQAEVSGGNFTTASTDDPSTGTAGDATVTEVVGPPQILPPTGNAAYTEGSSATVVDGAFSLATCTPDNFAGGTLSVDFAGTGTANDRLSIVSEGTGAGQIDVTGNTVRFGGAAIGNVAGGANGSQPLVITFGAAATDAAVQQLLRRIGYRNTSQHPTGATRTIRFTLTDSLSQSSNQPTRTVTITFQNDPPTIDTNTGASVDRGAAVTLTTAHLSASDVDNTASELTYTVTSGPGHGQIRLSGSATTTFTQTQLAANQVSYQHDNVNQPTDSFTFTVQDPATATAGPATFNLTITHLFGPANSLAVTTQPTDGTAGVNLNPVTVEVRDVDSQRVEDSAATITASLGNANGASLGGTTSVAAVNGIATFNNLRVDQAGTGYTLVFNGTGLNPGTSAQFSIAAAATAPAQSTATVPNGTVGEATGITVVARDAFGNRRTAGGETVHVTISGANPGTPVVTDHGDGTYSARYIPQTAGTDQVAITIGGTAVQGSPFTSQVSPAATYAPRSTASVPNGTVGEGTSITIIARDVYGNRRPTGGDSVNVTISGANAATATVTDNGDGSYRATYVPTTAGTDQVAITIGGVAIQGSPFSSQVSPAGTYAPRSTANVPNGTVGEATAITVFARDVYGNRRPTGGDSVAVTISGANSANPTVADLGDGSYRASYVPTMAGTDHVVITLGGVAIQSSPFSSQVSPAGTYAPRSTANVPNGTVGEATAITVLARDVYGNRRPTGGDSVAVTISGANPASPTVTDLGDGSYRASYVPTLAGTDHVVITIGGVPIEGSPFSSLVSPAATYAPQSTATVPNGTVGEGTSILIVAKDVYANRRSIGGDTLTVTVSGANTATATVTDLGDGSYRATYVPTMAGTDQVAILIAGVPIQGSAFTSQVSPAATYAPSSTATVPDGLAGAATTITVIARDVYGNRRPSGGDAVAISITGGNTASPAVTDHGDGSYTASYTPTVAGTDQVTITIDGVPLGGSPFSSRVAAGAPDPTQSTVTANPLQAAADGFERIQVTLTLHDRFGNPIAGIPAAELGLTSDLAGPTVGSPAATDAAGGTTFPVTSSTLGRFTLTATARGVTIGSVDIAYRARYVTRLEAGTHFLALPFTPDNPRPEAVLGEPANWRLKRWDPAIADYREYRPGNDPSFFNLVPGRGDWIRLTQPVTIQVLGTPPPSGPFTLPLAVGWNNAGNPFETDLIWDPATIGVIVNGARLGTLADTNLWDRVRPFAWVWNPVTQSDELVFPGLNLDRVPAEAGFWALATVPDVALELTPTPAARRAAPAPPTARDWRVDLIATGGGHRAAATIGVTARLSRALPIEAPPEAAGRPFRIDLLSDGRRLAGELRPGDGRTQTWDLEVIGDGDLSLSWPGLLRTLPRGIVLELQDLETGQTRLLNTRAAYSWRSTTGTRRFRLTARTGNLERATITSLSLQGTRGNGEALTLTLSAPADVTLTVTGLGGQLVKQVDAGTLPAGTSTVAWDGTDQSGRRVPRGTYLLKATATSPNGAVSRVVRTVTVR